MYADDTHLTFASNDVDCIDLYPINVSDWLIANKTLNKFKTEFMLIGSR